MAALGTMMPFEPITLLNTALLVGLIMSDRWGDAAQAPDMDFEVFGFRGICQELTEEFANLACFLATERGSFLTGAAINIDGGCSPVV